MWYVLLVVVSQVQTPLPTPLASPALTATIVPITTTTIDAAKASTVSGLPVVPIFLAVIFLSLVLAVVVPIIKGRLRNRRK